MVGNVNASCICGLPNDVAMLGRWCEASAECVSPRSVCRIPGPILLSANQCHAPTPCSRHTSCSECNYQAECGWCAADGRCTEGHVNGPNSGYCSSSYWRWGSCNARTAPHLTALWVSLGVGIVVTIIGFSLVVCIRRLRQRAPSDAIELSVASSSHSDDMFASSSPQITTALPGYMYTTTSAPNQPSYVYTAVPVGPVVSSIPTQ